MHPVRPDDPPFHTLEYALSYPGAVERRPSSPCPVFTRRIAGQPHRDGCLPWPYVWLDRQEGEALRAAHRDLVSLSGVVAPSRHHPWHGSGDLVAFKEHFIFDPKLGSIVLSRKSRGNLAAGRKVWGPAEASSAQDWADFHDLYRALVQRRALTGGSFDYGAEHFARLSRLPCMNIYGVRDGSRWGAMACAACFRDEMHLLHIVVSPEGLSSNASYVLMHEITTLCKARGLVLFAGGMPRGDNGGVLRFKRRWTNQTGTSWLVRMIIQPGVYQSLALPGNPFFPAYREPT